jgi:hypothetical protein
MKDQNSSVHFFNNNLGVRKKKKKTGNLTETRILENLKNQNKRFLS